MRKANFKGFPRTGGLTSPLKDVKLFRAYSCLLIRDVLTEDQVCDSVWWQETPVHFSMRWSYWWFSLLYNLQPLPVPTLHKKISGTCTRLCHFEGLANSSSVRLYNQSINQSCEWTCRGEGSIVIFVTHKQLTLFVFIMCAHEDDAITLEVVYCRAEGECITQLRVLLHHPEYTTKHAKPA